MRVGSKSRKLRTDLCDPKDFSVSSNIKWAWANLNCNRSLRGQSESLKADLTKVKPKTSQHNFRFLPKTLAKVSNQTRFCFFLATVIPNLYPFDRGFMILLPARDAQLNLWNAPWKFLLRFKVDFVFPIFPSTFLHLILR